MSEEVIAHYQALLKEVYSFLKAHKDQPSADIRAPLIDIFEEKLAVYSLRI